MTTNARIKKAPMSTQKKLCTVRKLTKVTFSHDKISMSMSSTDKYIPGMFCWLTYVDITSAAHGHVAFRMFFKFFKYIHFLAKYCTDSMYQLCI